MNTKLVGICQPIAAALLALAAASQALAGGKESKIEMCHNGHTILVSGHSAERHLEHGDAVGACNPCDPPIGDDGKVAICRKGKTERVKPEKACREIVKGKAELGDCDVGDDSDDDSGDDDSDDDDSDDDAPAPPPDTDGDGILDAADACPGTAPGDPTGADGCSCAQRGDCDADGDGVYDRDDACPGTPAGDETYADGCTVVTLSASAGPDVDAIPGDTVDVVGQGSVLTGDYDPADLVYGWEQVGGDPVRFEATSPPLTVDTEGSGATATFMLTVSTADGSAEATDEFMINVDLDAVVLEAAVCDPDTGHCYARIDTLTWCSDMKAAANDMYYNGMRGHLATITTPAERSFLATVARNAPGIIAGTDRFEEGVWVWDDGPEEGQLIEWLPWASEYEPTNHYHWSYPEGEDYISNLARGWDDLNGWRRYYVEFEMGW